jgi:phage shock protein C
MTTSEEPRPGGPYRSRDSAIFGVCRGLAEHFDVSVNGFRVVVVIATLLTGLWPVIIAYIVAGLVMKPEPVVPFDSESDAEFYGSYTSSSTMALQRLKDTFDNLDRRIQRMESIVTSTDYDWDERLKDNR